MAETLEISPQEAQEQLADEGAAVLVDVREPEELALSSILGALAIPMRSIPTEFQKLDELADEQTLLVICHHGVRSLQVVAWLRDKGVENCYSVSGGIDRWSREVDASIPQYS